MNPLKVIFPIIFYLLTTSTFGQCDQTFSGEGTFYGYGGGGNCSFPDPNLPAMTGAMNQVQYDSSAICGACVRVTGPKGTLDIRIEDRCPECAFGDIDLAEDAFPYIANVIDGRVPITWKFIPCPVTGAIQFYFKEGSSQWWTAVQVRNHKYPVTTFEYKKNGVWTKVNRMMYNYFLVESGMGPGPFDFRITDIFGYVITESNIPLLVTTPINGTQQFETCTDISNITQNIDLQQGWNLISTNVVAPDNHIETLFAGLNVASVKNAEGYWKKGQNTIFNSLTTIEAGKGYLVFMNAPGTVSITGTAVDIPDFTIQPGWQIVGCSYQTSTPFSSVFSSANVETIKGFNGFWEPNGTVNSISNLIPGEGYFLKGK